jgi:hypothetical protein
LCQPALAIMIDGMNAPRRLVDALSRSAHLAADATASAHRPLRRRTR